MKVFIVVIALCVAGIVGQASSPSICDAQIPNVGVNGSAVMEALTSEAVTSMFLTDLVRFFDGSIPGTNNFTGDSNSAALATLISRWQEFHAQSIMLNCTDGSVPNFQGNPDMAAVHAHLPIQVADFNLYVSTWANAASFAGFGQSERSRFQALLQSFRYDICNNETACNPGSFCDKFSIAKTLTNSDFLSGIMDEIIDGVLNVPSLKVFFDGSVEGTTDFTDPANAALLATLKLHLVQFFADPTALGCTDATIGPYAGLSMVEAHLPFAIGLADYNSFANVILTVLQNNGVPTPDRDAVAAFLESSKPGICNQPDCNVAPVPPPDTGAGAQVSVSLFLILIAVILAL